MKTFYSVSWKKVIPNPNHLKPVVVERLVPMLHDLSLIQVFLFFRYARNLPVSRQTLLIKCKLCQLIDVVSILTSTNFFCGKHIR